MELPAHPHVATRHSKMKMTRRAFKRIVGALSRRYSGEDFRSEHATAPSLRSTRHAGEKQHRRGCERNTER